MRRVRQSQRWFGAVVLLLSLAGCYAIQLPKWPFSSDEVGVQVPDYCPESPKASTRAVKLPKHAMLQTSWEAFRERFIQADGRVIDREVGDRSTSEDQATVMLRAVLMNDYATFARVFTWGENNLSRKDTEGRRIEQLWAQLWGQTVNNEWRILEPSFASGADVDATTALILAARRWDCPRYLEIARAKLEDLWNLSTTTIKGKRYLLSSNSAYWEEPNSLLLNTSYFAPYAFRLFAQVDSKHDWLSLIDSGYTVLQESARLSKVALPSDWVLLNSNTSRVSAIKGYRSVQTTYGVGAARIWWRLALDFVWFKDPRAKQFLQSHTTYLRQLWQKDRKIFAQIDLEGEPILDSEATTQYAMLYAALQLIDPPMANQIYQLKLQPKYQGGFWDHHSAYRTQNLVWLAIATPTSPTQLLKP